LEGYDRTRRGFTFNCIARKEGKSAYYRREKRYPDFEITISTTNFLNTWFETGDMWFPRLGLRLPKTVVCVNLTMVIKDWSRTDRLAFQFL
jgi:hypothetical protein